MLNYNEMIDIVSAANIAGHMEQAGRVFISDDEELFAFISGELDKYNNAAQVTMGCSNGENWYGWIEDALVREYGPEA